MFCKSNGLWNHRTIDTHLQAQQSLDNYESDACRMTLITKNSVIRDIQTIADACDYFDKMKKLYTIKEMLKNLGE